MQDTLEELIVDEKEYEEMKESLSRMSKDLDQALENSLLNKSQLTMEDNNKKQRKSTINSKKVSSPLRQQQEAEPAKR